MSKQGAQTETSSRSIDYDTVARYWEQSAPTLAAVGCMKTGRFATAAARFRHNKEIRIVQRILKSRVVLDRVLDLGSGVGQWSTFFAPLAKEVVSVERSAPLYEALCEQSHNFNNIIAVQEDALEFIAPEPFDLVFAGGLFMYLNDGDLINLLGRLRQQLRPGGWILCRDSTIRVGSISASGDYQARYRSVEEYYRLFMEAKMAVAGHYPNWPFILLNMIGELVEAYALRGFRGKRVLRRALYLMGRATYPWSVRLAGYTANRAGRPFPVISNHYFVLVPAD